MAKLRIKASASSRSYYTEVAKHLGGKLISYEASGDGRDIEIEIDGERFEIRQSWRKDGTPSKPVTQVFFGYPDSKTINLGRFAIWDDDELGQGVSGAKAYAEDLQKVIKREFDSLA
jgi:hypothetical protein